MTRTRAIAIFTSTLVAVGTALLLGAAPPPTAFSRALSSFGADAGIRRLPVTAGSWSINTATTVPVGVHVDVQAGAQFSKVGDGGLTIKGPFTAPLTQQVFSGFSAGDVKFGAGVREISAAWFGVKCDGNHDDTAELQKALTAVAGATDQSHPWDGFARSLVLPPGSCMISNTLTLDKAIGVTLRGANRWTTAIQWNGYAGGSDPDNMVTAKPMLRCYNCRETQIRDLDFQGLAGYPPTSGIDFLSDTSEAGLVWAPTGNTIEDCKIGSTAPASLYYGITFTQGAGVNAVNDYARMRRLSIGNYITAGIRIGHSESRGHELTASFLISGGGQYGIIFPATPVGDRGRGGSIARIEGNYFANHAVAAIQMGWPNDPVHIVGNIFEGDNRWIVTQDSAGYPGWGQALIVAGNTFSCNGLNADRQGIVLHNYGPVEITGNRFNNVPPAATNAHIVASNAQAVGSLVVEGNLWDGQGASTEFFDPVQAGSGWILRREGNLYRTEVPDTCEACPRDDAGIPSGARYAADPIAWPDAGL